MGLFDKLKKAVSHTGITTEEVKPTPSPASVPTPTPVESLEDLSGLDNLQVLEKIDSYCSAYSNSMNNNTLNNLCNAIKEFDKRFNSLPLSQRGCISQDWSFVKIQLSNIESMKNTPTAANLVVNLNAYSKMYVDQLKNYVAKIYTELTK